MKKGSENVRIPKLRDIETAIQIYYSNLELDNENIRKIFITQRGGELSSATIASLKDLARKEMRERDIPVYNGYRVNTEVAYETWGINISDLENRYKKLQKLKLGTN